jgi:hypothetical protein
MQVVGAIGRSGDDSLLAPASRPPARPVAPKSRPSMPRRLP